jgi:hypothetical protein
VRYFFTFFVLVLTLSSCAYVTQSEQTAADRYLKGPCKDLFLSSRTSSSSYLGDIGYQYLRYTTRAFAVANYGDRQFCGMANDGGGFHVGGSRTAANEKALSICNNQLPSGLTCSIFAENDTIINVPPNYPIISQTSPASNITETKPVTAPTSSININDAKSKCSDLGFKLGTERFGDCVLRLSK